jgi:hypothetical protein
MSAGNPNAGLLKAIIEVLRQEEPGQFVHYLSITKVLEERGQWDESPSETPERAVNMYLSQNTPAIFTWDGAGSYHLSDSYRCP